MSMSFEIVAIINKLKEETERENGHLEEKDDDNNVKSKITQAIKLFS